MILNDYQKQQLLDTSELLFNNRKLPKNVKRKLLLDAKLKQIQHEVEVARIKNQVDKWLELNEGFISENELKTLWKNVSTKTCLEFVKLAITSLALVDGINKSEDIFNYVLDMKQIQIDKTHIANLSDKVFGVQVLDLILNNSNLNEVEKNIIRTNFIQSKFPIKNSSTLVERIAKEVQTVNQLAEGE